MARLGIDENVGTSTSVFDSPKLEPVHKDQRVRVGLNPDAICMEYRHSIGGQRNNCAEFGGNWICTGRPEVIEANGADVESCLLCRSFKGSEPVSKPTRKFIVQIVRYGTDPSGTRPMNPFQVTYEAWQFSDREYRQIVEAHRQWGDLRNHDLMLVCESKDFKTWDVSILPESWQNSSPELQQYVAAVVENQTVADNDLELLIGRRADNDVELTNKIQEVKGGPFEGASAYAQTGPLPGVAGPGAVPAAPPLGAAMPATPAAPAPAAPAPAAPAPAAPAAPPAAPAAPAAAPAAPPAPAPAAPAAAPAAPAPAPTAPAAPPAAAPQAAPPAAPEAPPASAAPAAPEAPAAPPAAPAAPAAPAPAPAAAGDGGSDFASLLAVPGAPPAPTA